MKPCEIVNAYLTAYTSGDIERAVSLVSEDFFFRGPMQATTGRSALRKLVAHLAANARGHRVLRQWQDGDDVCTLYRFNVETDTEASSLLVSEWNTVRSGQVASSLMVFDTGPFRGPGQTNRTATDSIADREVSGTAGSAAGLERPDRLRICPGSIPHP